MEINPSCASYTGKEGILIFDRTSVTKLDWMIGEGEDPPAQVELPFSSTAGRSLLNKCMKQSCFWFNHMRFTLSISRTEHYHSSKELKKKKRNPVHILAI